MTAPATAPAPTPTQPPAPGAAEPQPHPQRISRFDRVVWITGAMALALTLLLIWRGDRIGVGVQALHPAAGETGVSTRPQVAVQLDQPLAAATVPTLTFDPPVSGAVRAEGDQVIFYPAAPLALNTTYTVRLAPGLASATGRTLAEPVEWQFTTGQPGVLYLDSGGTAAQLHRLRLAFDPHPTVAMPAVALTRAPNGVWDAAVSPDGSRIAFSLPNADGTSDLWLINADGSGGTLLLACPNAFCATPAWSPDGRLLAFSQRNANEFAAAAVSPPRLYLLDLQTRQAVPMLADSQKLGYDPRWSPNGEWVTYLAPDQVGVTAYNVQSGESKFYPTGSGEVGAWRTQGTQFVMSEQVQVGDLFPVHLWLVDPVADTRRNLSGADALVQDGSPAWSPDGEWIAFRRNELTGERQSLSKQLWVMRADGSEARPLTVDPEYDYSAPQWSPDGRYLLYHRFPLKGPDVRLTVWAIDVATGQQHPLADPGQRPQWLP